MKNNHQAQIIFEVFVIILIAILLQEVLIKGLIFHQAHMNLLMKNQFGIPVCGLELKFPPKNF